MFPITALIMRGLLLPAISPVSVFSFRELLRSPAADSEKQGCSVQPSLDVIILPCDFSHVSYEAMLWSPFDVVSCMS